MSETETPPAGAAALPDVSMRAVVAPTLALEPQVAAHAEAMFAVLSDPAIYEHENAPPRSLEWLRERFAKLETRRSGDGRERWLNWVIRLPDGELAGYVQATVFPDGRAAIAYELASRFWGRGIARAAVEAMIEELYGQYDVRTLSAVLKRTNLRSMKFVERLGFAIAPAGLHARFDVESDEILMLREARRIGTGPDECRSSP